MSDQIRNMQDIQKELESYLDSKKLEKSLWEQVELLKKKDGSNFKQLSKSFSNATYGSKSYMISYSPEITVAGRSEQGRWESFSIDCYLFLDDMKAKNDPRYTGQPLRDGCIRSVYLLDADEIYQRIQEHITNLEKGIKRYEDQLEALPHIFKTTNDLACSLSDNIKMLCEPFKNGIYPSSLEYALYNYVAYIVRYRS